MSMVLMCKNIKVFDIEDERVYNNELLPGLIKVNPSKSAFLSWLKLRYSSTTNASARRLKGVTFGQGKWMKAPISAISNHTREDAS